MSAPAWIEPFLAWLTTSPIRTTDLRRIESNTKHLRDGATVFSGTKQFTNNVEMLSQLIVRAETILREVVQISGSLSMLGNITVSERPGFGGTGNVTIGGTGQLTVGGAATFNSNTIFNGDVSVSGALVAPSIDTGFGPFEVGQNLRTTDNVTFPGIFGLQTINGHVPSQGYTGSNLDLLDYPIGQYISVGIISGASPQRNASFAVFTSANAAAFQSPSGLSQLQGTWVCRGESGQTSGGASVVLAQRIS